jgi:antibiotic biosynthesis monooxygenase (ABM) superfamily enzyme
MIWIAVFPTLTVLNLALGGWLKTLAPVPRTFILATVAVPIVIYGLMPQLHRLRSRLLSHAGSCRRSAATTLPTPHRTHWPARPRDVQRGSRGSG